MTWLLFLAPMWKSNTHHVVMEELINSFRKYARSQYGSQYFSPIILKVHQKFQQNLSQNLLLHKGCLFSTYWNCKTLGAYGSWTCCIFICLLPSDELLLLSVSANQLFIYCLLVWALLNLITLSFSSLVYCYRYKYFPSPNPYLFVQLNFLISEDRQREIIDSNCEGVQSESLDALLAVATQCVSSSPDDRPTMHRVVQILESEVMTPCPSDFYDSNSDWKLCGDNEDIFEFASLLMQFVEYFGWCQQWKGD